MASQRPFWSHRATRWRLNGHSCCRHFQFTPYRLVRVRFEVDFLALDDLAFVAFDFCRSAPDFDFVTFVFDGADLAFDFVDFAFCRADLAFDFAAFVFDGAA